jgi:hypothetical protein
VAEAEADEELDEDAPAWPPAFPFALSFGDCDAWLALPSVFTLDSLLVRFGEVSVLEPPSPLVRALLAEPPGPVTALDPPVPIVLLL